MALTENSGEFRPPKGFLPLDLSHEKIFAEYASFQTIHVSELTFTNLYMWRKYYRTHFMVYGDCILIIQDPGHGRGFHGLMPLGAGDKVLALDYLVRALKENQNQVEICRVDKEFVEKYVDPTQYAIHLNCDQSDYVYLVQDLIRLSGRSFHKKKNLLNKFIRQNNYEYRVLDKERVDSVLKMQTSWCDLKHCELDPGLNHEDLGIKDLLIHFDKLNFVGGLILIDGQVAAFSLAERLNPTTCVIHVEKADPNITGLYAAMNQMFLAHAFDDVIYVNREQDLGVESLRKAKKSYNPHHLVDKYDIMPLT